MRGIYSLSHLCSGVNSARTLLAMVATDVSPLAVDEILSAAVTNANNNTREQLRCALQRISSYGTPTATSLTPKKHEQGDQASMAFGYGNVTASEPTYASNTEVGMKGFSSLAGWKFRPQRDGRMAVPPGGGSLAVGLRLLDAPSAPVDLLARITFRERAIFVATPTPVQNATGESNNTNSLAASFSGASTNGNYLVAALNVQTGGGPTVTPPAGWSLAVTVNGTGTRTAIYYRENAPATTTVTFTLTNNPISATLVIAEYSSVRTSSPLDVTASNSGSGTSLTTGTTGTTAQGSELIIAAVGNTPGGVNTFSSPLNGFSIVNQITEASDRFSSVAMLARVVSSVSTYSSGATSSASQPWAAAIATFKGA